MTAVTYAVKDHVAHVHLDDGENRFNPPFLAAFLRTLDDIENRTPASTMIVTSSHDKIFSNGIDLEWLVQARTQDPDSVKRFLYQLNQLFIRLLTYPLVTIAAVSGHAFAGGAILCCAFDFRFMRSDRGYFCLPEVDLGIPFLPGMNALLHKAIPDWLLYDMQLTGLRLTAEQCRQAGVAKEACPGDRLIQAATTFAEKIDKKREVVAEMKQRMHKSIIRCMEVDDVPYIETAGFQIIE